MLRLLVAVAAWAFICAYAGQVQCDPNDLCFASGLGSGAVLQQAPARAAVFGSLPALHNPDGAAILNITIFSAARYSKTYFADVSVVSLGELPLP